MFRLVLRSSFILLVSVAAAATQKQIVPLTSGWAFHQLISGRAVQTASSVGTDASQWHTAAVPGCVHLDLLRNKLIPDPFYRNNEAKLKSQRASQLLTHSHESDILIS